MAFIAVGVASLLWYSNTDKDDDPISSKLGAESHDSSQAGAATPQPAATPDHFEDTDKEPPEQERIPIPCNEQAPSKHRSLPNGSRIMPESPTTGYGELEVQNGTSDDAVLSLYDLAGVPPTSARYLTTIPSAGVSYTVNLPLMIGCTPEFRRLARPTARL